MLNLGIGDKLLIKQAATVPVTPWGYRVIYIPGSVTITDASGLNFAYVEIPLTDNEFGSYENRELLLEILNNSGTVIESDTLLLSDTYVNLGNVKLLTGLLGENCKVTSDQENDYENGHEKAKIVNLYSDDDLTIDLEEYTWGQTFVSDFRPDYRYQTNKVVQKEST